MQNKIIPDQFLTNILNKPCFRVNNLEGKINFTSNAFYYYKFAYNSEIIERCNNNKFLYITSQVNLQKKVSQIQDFSESKAGDFTFSDNVNKKELKQLFVIAKVISKNSRFFQDRNIRNYNETIHNEWVNNSFFNDYASDYLIARDQKKIIGFCTLKNVRIDLMCVKNNYQHRGVGSRLINTILKKNLNKIITVGTQAENIQAINFYLKNQFKIHSYELIFHKTT